MTSHIGSAMPLQAQAVTELASWENEGGHSLPTAQAGERLEWEGFVARFYPHAHEARLRATRRVRGVSEVFGAADVAVARPSMRPRGQLDVGAADKHSRGERP